MPDRPHIGLDNPAFRGRLRQPISSAQSLRVNNVRPSARYFNDFTVISTRTNPLFTKSSAPKAAVRPSQAAMKPKAPTVPQKGPAAYAGHRIQKAQTAQRRTLLNLVEAPADAVEPKGKTRKKRFAYSKTQWVLMSMAVMVFLVGIMVSLLTLRTNHAASTQVAALSKQATDAPAASTNSTTGSSASTPPSTVRPSAGAVSNYAVGPDMPRYLNIPKLDVHARVLSLGILNSGALATPNNVYDVGWYNESSKPGQPGAMLIDGHVSSWTAHGVFYGIKTLKAGDKLQVVRGDGQVFTYSVVKSQVFDHNKVDMQSAVTPVTPGKPGLNLITCTGDVIHGTNEFNERVLVYAEQD